MGKSRLQVKSRAKFYISSSILLVSILLTGSQAHRNFEVNAQTDNPWPMVGANPERTSWTPEEVKGSLKPLWYRKIEPFVSYKHQIIAVNGNLYISSARGLYAFNADSGAQLWVYPTALPLGNSPTYSNGVLYVGGYDRRIHAIDATTGQLKNGWNFYEAEAGFETNPLVISNVVYAGNRDGYFYAMDAGTGALKWRYKAGGPILYSAAYKNGIIYFAAQDSHAYAIKAVTTLSAGEEVWKKKLVGAEFYSYWPVIYQNFVIFSSDWGYRNVDPGNYWHTNWERMDIYGYDPTQGNKTIIPNGTPVGPIGAESGQWVSGTETIDTSKPSVTSKGSTTPIATYFENKPWRRTVYYLNLGTGAENTFDWDKDGKPEYAPFLYFGTHTGSRYPPVVGGNGVIYQSNNTHSNTYLPRGRITGWKVNTPFISINSASFAVDEPVAYSAGGNMIYYSLCCDRQSGHMDLTKPSSNNTAWHAYSIRNLLPDYTSSYYANDYNGWGLFGSVNGVYGKHGVQSPPIPYRGKVYELKGNSLIAWSPSATSVQKLSESKTVSTSKLSVAVDTNALKNRLKAEVAKIIAAGHLQPGYASTGVADQELNRKAPGDYLLDYWKNPSDIHQVLTRALPHLSSTEQSQLKNYLQAEFNKYPPYTYVHIGWKDGVQRELFGRKPEVESDRTNFPARTSRQNTYFSGWNFPPHQFYGMWKYAVVNGNAKTIFDNAKSKLPSAPSNTYLIERPYVLNAYIAGYRGYVELEKLAGYTSAISQSTKYAEYRRLVDLRINNFSKDSPYVYSDTPDGYTSINYDRALNISRNFMFLTPELADEMRSRILSKVTEALNEYDRVAPGWFVSHFDSTTGEGSLQHLYDSHSLFQARALILKQSQTDLARYLDIPTFATGDLFYIDNLISTIEAGQSNPVVAGDANGDGVVDGRDYTIWLINFNQTTSQGASVGDFDKSGKVDSADYTIWLQNYNI